MSFDSKVLNNTLNDTFQMKTFNLVSQHSSVGLQSLQQTKNIICIQRISQKISSVIWLMHHPIESIAYGQLVMTVTIIEVPIIIVIIIDRVDLTTGPSDAR